MRCLRGGFFFSVTISPACWTTIAFSAVVSVWQAERFVWAIWYWPMRSTRGNAATSTSTAFPGMTRAFSGILVRVGMAATACAGVVTSWTIFVIVVTFWAAWVLF